MGIASFYNPRLASFWLLLMLGCAAMLGGALFFQHGLGDDPCELCIYVRVWVILIFLASLAGLLLRQWLWPVILLLLVLIGLCIGLAQDVWVLLSIDYGWPTDDACMFVANFPQWAPLDQWLPAVFEVRNLCQPTPLLLWSVSMADATAAACLVILMMAAGGLFSSWLQ